MSLQDTPFIADTKEVIADAITTSGGLLTADDVAGEAARGVLCTIVNKIPNGAVCVPACVVNMRLLWRCAGRDHVCVTVAACPSAVVGKILDNKAIAGGSVIAISAKAGTLLIPYSTAAIIKSGSKL